MKEFTKIIADRVMSNAEKIKEMADGELNSKTLLEIVRLSGENDGIEFVAQCLALSSRMPTENQ